MISGKETLQQALIEAFSLEKGMREFYRFAEVETESEEARRTYEMLRGWEGRHMEYIESLYVAVMGDRELQSYMEFAERTPSGFVEAGLSSIEAKNMLADRKPKGEAGIIDFALEMEEGAHHFYRILSQSAEDDNAKVIFKEMVTQEQKHIDGLRSLKEKFKDQ
ncbi:MAG: hypothetical protein JSV21_01780 [Nitrospirota bacterium]|nr:MAG: hypothetical protein JSV21_01780 [Nitrospirota bacterium]